MQQNYAIPILPSRNLLETIEFYQQLGFETIDHWAPRLIVAGGEAARHNTL